IANGAQWPDNTNQLSAYTGAAAFGSIGGTTYTGADVTLDEHGRITNIVSGGGGGGTVTNPMTSDLDGGGYSIFNVDTFSGMDLNLTGLASVENINNSAAQAYYDQGAIIPARWFIADLDPRANGEAHMMVVSRCLDPGFKQTTVFTVTAFENRASINVLMNLCEADTPIFDSIVVGDNGSTQMFVFMNCVTASSTWEIRVYQQQDDKGTGSYGTFWNVISPATAAGPPTTTYAEFSLGFQPEGQSGMTGDLSIKDGITCNTLGCDVATATTSVTTNTVYTNELRDNGLGVLDTFAPLRMNNNDIQSAAVIGGTAFVGAALNLTIPIGHPTTGPLYVDTQNNRIGINVPVPTEDLEIDGNLQLDSAGANKIKFYDATATVERAEIDAAASGTGGILVFYTKEDPGTVTAKMTIQADGRVTITNRIEGVTNPVAATDAANKQYVDASIPSLTGYVQNPMTSALDGAGFAINNILDPVAAQDAATKNYVDTVVPPAGVQNPMISNLDGGTFDINNVTSVLTINNVTSGDYMEAYGNIYAGQALGSPLQAFCKFELPYQSSLGTGVMPRWKGGYLQPQVMMSKCTCAESVTAPAAHKLNSVSLISTAVGAYNLTAPSAGPGTNILIEIPASLDRHTFNIQVDGEWNGSGLGGNGNFYMFIREDANPAGPIYGMTTGQVIDGARYPLCLNFVGSLPAGIYAILLGHYDLGANRDYTGTFSVRYLGDFGG
ncbi:MAG: hypothetical protein ACPHF2_09700, partial [Crocinitomicaceae bacterium]